MKPSFASFSFKKKTMLACCPSLKRLSLSILSTTFPGASRSDADKSRKRICPCSPDRLTGMARSCVVRVASPLCQQLQLLCQRRGIVTLPFWRRYRQEIVRHRLPLGPFSKAAAEHGLMSLWESIPQRNEHLNRFGY